MLILSKTHVSSNICVKLVFQEEALCFFWGFTNSQQRTTT